MAENSFKMSSSTEYMKYKYKVTGLPAKRPALTAINGNNSRKCNNNSKLSYVSQKQPAHTKITEVFNEQKFQIYEDSDNIEDNSKDKENNCTFVFKVPAVEFSSSKDCFDSLDVKTESPKTCDDLKKKAIEITENLWYTPYQEDIYLYFKTIENNFQPNANYMEKQADITMNMRSILVDWLVEVGEEYKLHVETIYLAVSCVDRFLSNMSVLRGKLQLVGAASMFIAAKYEEIYPPELKDFVYITDDTYTKKQILRMEHLILKVLNFELSNPTIHSFLQLFCSMCFVSETAAYLAQYICELSLLDGDPFLKFTPSSIASASIALANYTLGLDIWNETMIDTTGYELKELYSIIIALHEKYSLMPTCPQQAIYEKYKSTKYGCVANIQHPENFIISDAT